MGMEEKKELVLVMPVYNEGECIVEVVNSWRKEFNDLGINATLLVLNDGSKDNTEAELAKLSDPGRIDVINKPNSGHGPTILVGYHKAVEQAEWVFQVDSDDEMLPNDFHKLWEQRNDHDFLIGIRQHRVSPLPRRIISQDPDEFPCPIPDFCKLHPGWSIPVRTVLLEQVKGCHR